MIIKINSGNNQLLDVLNRNPNTDEGLYLQSWKRGVLVGNAVSAHQYDVVFQDQRRSYVPEDSSSIDFQSYSSPQVVLDICSEMFNHLTRNRDEYLEREIKWLAKSYKEIDNEKCTIEVPTFYIHSGWAQGDDFLLSKYFDGVQVVQKVGHNYTLTIEGNTIFDAINLLCIVCVFVHITNRYGISTYIDDMYGQKYARILTNYPSVPYFVFYLFIKRLAKTERLFSGFKPVFEQYLSDQGIEAKLTYLPTHKARINYIVDRIDKSRPVLDIGCGEFLYYKSLIRRNFFEEYVGVDEDPKFAEIAKIIDMRYGSENLTFYTDLESVDKGRTYNIILSEVIEHNPMDDAVSLVRSALTFNMNQCIITTPNVEFNKFYSDSLESRHDDHDFELTREEFIEFINKCIDGRTDLDVEIDFIGDSLNGIQPTQVAVIKPKNK